MLEIITQDMNFFVLYDISIIKRNFLKKIFDEKKTIVSILILMAVVTCFNLSSLANGLTSVDMLLSTIQKILSEKGFENVIIQTDKHNRIWIGYENRVFRNELLAAGVVLAFVSQEMLDDSLEVILVPLNRGLAICEIEISLKEYRRFMTGEIEPRYFADNLNIREFVSKMSPWHNVSEVKKLNPSFRKFDITVRPGTTIQLGNYDDRFKLYGYLLPDVKMNLWRGGAMQMQMLIPIYDEIGIYTNEVRLSKFSTSQIFKIPLNGFGSVSFGAFQPDRWGFSGELCWYFFNRHILLGSVFDYTGFLLYQDKNWNYSQIGHLTGRGYCYYYFDKIDLSVGLNYSKYLMGDKGWLSEISRIFGETEVGVYFASTNVDKFGGVRFRIPFPPAKRFKPAFIRLNSPRYYDWSYRSSTKVYTYGVPVQTGISVSTGVSLKEFQKNMVTSYIRNNIHIWKKSVRYMN